MLDTLPPNFILINKPAGWTSFDVVNYIRKQARLKTGNKNIKVGHAGTLDPFATGLLIVGIGRAATKRLDEFKGMKKTYVATVHLGATSDTYDVTGKIEIIVNRQQITDKKTIVPILQSFIGIQLQTPPMHSAKKIGGQRLYKLARQGKVVERQPNEIEIYQINLLEYKWPLLKIEVTCSAGTYIRTLAYDIGEKLGVGAYCEALERTAIGEYKLDRAVTIDKIKLADVQ